jgi:hypothetical protein
MIEEKDLYQQKLEAQINELKAEIDKLNAKLENMEADTKLEYQKERNNLQQQLDKAQERVERLTTSGTEAWEEIRQGTERAVKELSQSLENARSKF